VLVSEATANIANYRNWLVSAVAESERLYKIQTQSLSAAQQAIEQSRQRLSHAFEKLASLTQEVEENLNENNAPRVPEFTRTRTLASTATSDQTPATKGDTKKSVKAVTPRKATSAKKTAPKRPVKKAAGKTAKKSTRK